MKQIKKALAWKGIPLSYYTNKYDLGKSTFSFVSNEVEEDFASSLGFDKSSSIIMHHKFTWANIAHCIGLCNSVSDARKANWNVYIESGYSEAVFFARYGNPLFVFILK